MSYVTVGCPPSSAIEFLEEYGTEGLEEISSEIIPRCTKVFVNGNWLGVHRRLARVDSTLRQMRRRGDLQAEVAVVRNVGAQEVILR